MNIPDATSNPLSIRLVRLSAAILMPDCDQPTRPLRFVVRANHPARIGGNPP